MWCQVPLQVDRGGGEEVVNFKYKWSRGSTTTREAELTQKTRNREQTSSANLV